GKVDNRPLYRPELKCESISAPVFFLYPAKSFVSTPALAGSPSGVCAKRGGKLIYAQQTEFY
ncbi:hypothetical protein, partial [uncultured Duncaniella sp.]|uniref:hypothetical protein n=1 Tax=uncultured Duncaniella sp. TaxID=2768039 RepID=UPI0025E0706C